MEIGGLLFFETNPYFFMATFAVLGGGIKYIDDAFDEGTFDKNKAKFLAPVLGVLWAYVSLVNKVAATLLFGILLSVLLKGKIDNHAHQIGFITVVALLFLAGAEIKFVALAFLVIAGLIDEAGNDFMDERMDELQINGKVEKFLLYFFEYRSLMKVVVLVFATLRVIPLYFLVAFLLFDGAYHLIRWYSERQKPRPVPSASFDFTG